MVWPAIIAGAAALGGSLMGQSQTRSDQNKKMDKANRFTAAQADIDRAYQKEYAQNALGWQIQQARKNGINPLAVLGNSPTYGPQFASSVQPDQSKDRGSAYSEMGLALANALTPKTKEQKRLAQIGIDTEQAKLDALQLGNVGTTLEILEMLKKKDVGPSDLRSQIIQGQNDMVDVNKAQQTAKSGKGFEAGSHAEYKVKEQADGSYLASPADQQGIDEAPFFVLQRLYKRGVDYAQGMMVMIPWEKARQKGFEAARRYKPNWAPKPGYVWAYHPIYGDWKQVRIKYKVSEKVKRAERLKNRKDFGKNSRGQKYKHHRLDGRR